MRTAVRSNVRPVVTAFAIWFAHFMLCWVAVEIWPQGWRANLLAWGLTAVALGVMGLYFVQFQRHTGGGEPAHAARVLTRGAFAIATVAVLFTALPSIVFRP